MDKIKNNNLKNWQEQIDDYLLGKLSEKDGEAFETYCFGNPDFLEEVKLREQLHHIVKEEGEELIAGLKKENQAPKPIILSFDNAFQKLEKNWFYVAAAAMLLAFLYFVPDLIKKETPQIDLANFEEHEYYESVLNQTYMSAGISVSIQSPQIGENFEQSVEFLWDAQKDGKTYSSPLDLILMNNKENKLLLVEVENGKYTLEEELLPGVYYWVIEYQKEMLYLGKFFVKKPEQ